jgi:hypothetical protein
MFRNNLLLWNSGGIIRFILFQESNFFELKIELLFNLFFFLFFLETILYYGIRRVD